MSSIETSKPHVVCVACPAQGHLTPMMQIARVLHSRGFHITLVNTEFNHNRLVRSQGADSFKGLTNFQFETIPDGLPPSDRDATQDLPTLCEALRTNCLSPFLELLNRLNSSSETPPVTCIVADGLMSFAIKAAEALGIPEFQLWTASASAFMGYIHFCELLKRGIVPFKNENFQSDGTLDTPIDWIPGVRNIRLRDMPSFMRVNDADDIMFDFMGSEAQNSLKATGGIIFNTFDELEHEVLEAIAAKLPRIYKTGPLLMLARHIPSNCPSKSISSSLWKEDTNCIEWLNKREPGSVVYVNFGSIVMMSEQHLKEFAWGLANCKHPFLWIVRPDVVRGESAALPEEFLEEIKDRGLISSWCAQNQVLCHPSVGVFLTHCGWNSVLEAISGGVPLICWPSFGDQPTHCRYAYTSWGIGLEADQDVKRENIESLVREMMEGEKGKEIKGKALEWKKKAEAASDVGGSSYNDFDRFVKEALCHG